uniref:Uncharacterized protein n=1 Tax=Arundo donax TaxID=35708 RepID=A0A0A9BMA3_ARUDO
MYLPHSRNTMASLRFSSASSPTRPHAHQIRGDSHGIGRFLLFVVLRHSHSDLHFGVFRDWSPPLAATTQGCPPIMAPLHFPSESNAIRPSADRSRVGLGTSWSPPQLLVSISSRMGHKRARSSARM